MYTQIKNNNQINQFNVPNIKLTTFNNQQPIKKIQQMFLIHFQVKTNVYPNQEQ